MVTFGISQQSRQLVPDPLPVDTLLEGEGFSGRRAHGGHVPARAERAPGAGDEHGAHVRILGAAAEVLDAAAIIASESAVQLLGRLSVSVATRSESSKRRSSFRLPSVALLWELPPCGAGL